MQHNIFNRQNVPWWPRLNTKIRFQLPTWARIPWQNANLTFYLDIISGVWSNCLRIVKKGITRAETVMENSNTGKGGVENVRKGQESSLGYIVNHNRWSYGIFSWLVVEPHGCCYFSNRWACSMRDPCWLGKELHWYSVWRYEVYIFCHLTFHDDRMACFQCQRSLVSRIRVLKEVKMGRKMMCNIC